MDKVYQVFVSSTFTDLENERKKVSDTLAKAGFIPSGMELFPATSLQQLEFIKRVIDRCDYYLVIVGARYGSLDGDKSFTEKEYVYALSRNIPVLAFLHKEPGKIAGEKTDTDPAQIARLEAFRGRLKDGRIVHFWNDVNDLCMSVLTAVTSEVTLSPGVGWVRGDQAIDPKILQEAERLRIENGKLQSTVNELRNAEVTFPSHLAGPDDEFIVDLAIIKFHPRNIYGERKEESREVVPVGAPIGQMLIGLFEYLLEIPSEWRLKEKIGSVVSSIAFGRGPDATTDYEVSNANVEKLRFHLEALGLIRASARKGEYSSTIVWEITDKGRKYVTERRAIPTGGP